MQSVSYWEAWSLWWSGYKVDEMRMWGVLILWWGRIGKLMQFAGGLIVVLDLIGPERLRNFGSATSNVAERIRKKIDRGPRSIPMILVVSLGLIILAGSITALILLTLSETDLLPLIKDPATDTRPEQINTGAWIVLIFGSFMLAIAMTINFHRIPKLLAAIFTQNNPGHPARWIAFIVVVSGFHFDLLAS